MDNQTPSQQAFNPDPQAFNSAPQAFNSAPQAFNSAPQAFNPSQQQFNPAFQQVPQMPGQMPQDNGPFMIKQNYVRPSLCLGLKILGTLVVIGSIIMITSSFSNSQLVNYDLLTSGIGAFITGALCFGISEFCDYIAKYQWQTIQCINENNRLLDIISKK